MVSLLEAIKASWCTYGYSALHIVLLFLALVWFYLYGKEKEKSNLYQFTLVIIVMILGLQIVSLVLKRDTMPKLFYLLPYALLVSYIWMEICDKIKLRKNKWILVVLYAIIIQSGIGMEYTGNYLLANYNAEKISSTVIKMAEYLDEIEEYDDIYMLAPQEIATQIQEWDAKIRVAYGASYSYTASDLKKLIEEANSYGCNCIIVQEKYDDQNYIKRRGYRLISFFDGYSLYVKK